jgi:subtilisin
MLRLALVSVVLLGTSAYAESKRYILRSAQVEHTKSEVHKNGGQILRKMDSGDELVALLPQGAAEKLRARIPDLEVFEDIELQAVFRKNALPAVQPAQSIGWGLTAIKAREAHALNRGAGVIVCVIDTGVDKTHPDLAANIIGGRNYVVLNGYVDPTRYNDDNGHGSHVAGIIAALDNSIGTVGVAPEAKIYAVKALNRQGSGYLSNIADGVNECVNKGAKVINMSLGATQDPSLDTPLKRNIEAAIAKGVAVVVAAGNEGQDIKKTVPAGYRSTIAVAALDKYSNFPSWSNFGLYEDDLTAPGVSIYSTWKSGSYNTISGTSMASPFAAGVMALKISSASLGVVTINLGKSVQIQGKGLVNALATVQNLAPVTP